MEQIPLQLLYRRVALKEIKEDDSKTAGGIYIPDSAKDKNPDVAKALVVAVGDGLDDKTLQVFPMALKVGMKVVYRPGYAHKYKIEGEEYLLTNEAEIMAVIG